VCSSSLCRPCPHFAFHVMSKAQQIQTLKFKFSLLGPAPYLPVNQLETELELELELEPQTM